MRFLFLLGLLGLGSSLSTAQDAPDLTLPESYTASVVATGLRQPTQMTLGPDGRLWLSELSGGENAGTGQIVALDLTTGEREVLLSELFKPTGLAVLDDTLWLAAGRDLLRAPLVGGRPGAPEKVLENLPFNGRSNGALTPTPDGALLFETSGSRQGNGAAAGSGTLWRLEPTKITENPALQPLATGLKGAYAHTYDAGGILYTTEIGDDPVNGQAPPDELNRVVPGGDYGWPQCYGDRQPAQNYGGTPETCAETQAPLALFAPQSTPTSVVASPFEKDALLVALWGPATPGVVSVDTRTGAVTPFLSGLRAPQSLLTLPDGSLLVSDFSSGVLYRVTGPS